MPSSRERERERAVKGWGWKWYRGGGYLESNDRTFLRLYIYEFGYADIYDHIIQYGGCSLGRIRGDRKE